MKTFTIIERILALDAACTACEYPDIPVNLAAAISLLQDELDKVFSNSPPVDNFAEMQIEAVKQLADHPESFC